MIAVTIHTALTLFSSVFLGAGTDGAMAAGTVNVSLWDEGGATVIASQAPVPGIAVDPAAQTMGVKAMPDETKAGMVTFKVTNTSKERVHELIVVKLGPGAEALRRVAAEGTADDDEADEKGEVSDLDPGESGMLTVDLQPGKYLLICGMPGHSAAGMWTELTVN